MPRPASSEPASLAAPTATGPKMPPLTPIVLTSATPPASARPVSSEVGMPQKAGIAPSSPNAHTPSVTTPASAGSSAVPARPRAPSSIPITTQRRRSPLRSDRRPITISPVEPSAIGMPTSRPSSMPSTSPTRSMMSAAQKIVP
jgi:hypothetical protein